MNGFANRLNYFGCCLLLFSAFLCAGCAPDKVLTSGELKLTRAQIDGLAVQILKNTPEYTHFSKGAEFSWVLLVPEVRTNPQELQDKVLELLSKKYRVYSDEAALPESAVRKDAQGRLQSYKDGFSFSYTVTPAGSDAVKVQYLDHENPLAASAHHKIYKWGWRGWRIIEVGPMVCA